MDVRHPLEVAGDALLHLAPEGRNRHTPIDGNVELDHHPAFLVGHANTAMARQVTLDETAHAVDLARRIGGVAGEDVAGDSRVLGDVRRVVAPALSPRVARRSGTGRTSSRAPARCASTSRRAR